MKRLTRHARIAVASAVLTGGAVLGTGGAASAAVMEGAAHSQAATVTVQRGIRDDHDAGGYGYGRLQEGEYDDGWYSYGGRFTTDGRPGHQHHGYGVSDRWDGRDRYVRFDGRWIDVSLLRAYGAGRWYTDQLLWIGQ
ncbi:hypothetical protein [Streptomyces glomeratus]|uniref:Uncharacterized protein n=1 Tax=Streptomyces glomeratus TaxID=284452 RepID=A0ABP6LH72_9ACTN|nr:hypothetical protein [Streptomyces glomeratus]MCF1509293.1 hypothetical protein [Streptomyces glomeratus]